MPIHRYFADVDLTSTSTVNLARSERQHAERAMRIRLGDVVELIDGRGHLARARLIKTCSAESTLQIVQVVSDLPPPYSLELVQIVPRWERLCWIVEKATELGATRITLATSRGEMRNYINFERLRKLSIAALKQSGRLHLPEFSHSAGLEDLPQSEEMSPLFFADPNSAHSIARLPDKRPRSCRLVVGPERGFEPHHLRELQAREARGIRLLGTTLRSETAAVCALFALALWLEV